jgi:hypothetical protein
MRFTCFGAGATAGLYCTVGYAHIVSLRLRGVNRLSVFCLGGGGLSLRAAGHHPFEKIIIAGKNIKHRWVIISVAADRHWSLISFARPYFYSCARFYFPLFFFSFNYRARNKTKGALNVQMRPIFKY